MFLSGDDLSLFIIWAKVLRDQYRTDGIKCLYSKCPVYYVRVESNDALSLVDNDIIVKFYSKGYLSLQHTEGQSAYSRHLSCSERSKMGEVLVNNSVSQIYKKQCPYQGRQVLGGRGDRDPEIGGADPQFFLESLNHLQIILIQVISVCFGKVIVSKF